MLPSELRAQVLDEYHRAIARPDHVMTVAEAAWYYGYTVQWVRRLFVRRGCKDARITHHAMRLHLRRKAGQGRPRAALIKAQTRIA